MTRAPSSPTRTVASLAATAVVVAGLSGLVSAPIVGVLAAPTGAARWPVVGALGLWIALAVALALALAQQRRAPRRQWWLPLWLQHRLARVVEVSAFGVGGRRGWTTTNPEVGLDRLRRPSDDVTRRLRISGGAGEAVGSGDADRQVPPRHRRRAAGGGGAGGGGAADGVAAAPAPAPSGPGAGAAPLDRRLTGPMLQHQIQRGETWWSLAERHLGDGRRWADLRDLNLGVEASPGVLVDQDSVLRPGWRINVPAAAGAEAAVSASGRR